MENIHRKVFRTGMFKWLLLWIIGGSALVYTIGSRLTFDNSIASKEKAVLLKDGEFELITSKPISYAPSQSEVILSKELNNALAQIADHLIESPEKQLLITGQYTLKEENEAKVKRVGKLRAENIKRYLINLGADPSNIFTSAKMNDYTDNPSKFKGVEFSIIDSDRKVNTSPLFSESNDQMIDQAAFLLPYYTRDFSNLTVLNEELDNYIERILESPEMALELYTDRKDQSSTELINALHAHIDRLTFGVEINIIHKEAEEIEASDRDKQIVRIDIGLKRFQNSTEFLGS